MIDRRRLREARTFLFVPGSRPERFDKAAAAGADVVVIDLEDAVAHKDKVAARGAAADWLGRGESAVVRINASDTAWHSADIAMAHDLAAPVMLAKARGIAEVDAVAKRTGADVIPLIETSSGVLAAAEIAGHPGVARMAFGSIDLAAELGVDPENRATLLFARSTLVLASAAAGIAPPIDGVTTALGDPSVLADDVAYAARIGLSAKLCIHPRQVRTAHRCFAPSAAEIEWAQRILDSVRTDGAAVAIDGHMVDAPVVARAERILAVTNPDR